MLIEDMIVNCVEYENAEHSQNNNIYDCHMFFMFYIMLYFFKFNTASVSFLK